MRSRAACREEGRLRLRLRHAVRQALKGVGIEELP
jgi:hypothetical protein